MLGNTMVPLYLPSWDPRDFKSAGDKMGNKSYMELMQDLNLAIS